MVTGGWQRAGRKAGRQYRRRFGWRTDQGGAGGTREPSGAGGLTGHGERRELGAMVDGPRRSPGLRGWRWRQGILQP